MKLNSAVLKDALDRKGKTQVIAALDTGLSLATVNNALNGGDCHQNTGTLLCEYLDVDLAKAVVPRAGADQGKVDAA